MSARTAGGRWAATRSGSTRRDMDEVKDKFAWEAERKRLIRQREENLAEVRRLYADKIAAVNDELAKLVARKLTAVERYTEPADAPVRHCKTCGEEMLRATPENYRLMLDATPELRELDAYRIAEVHYSDLRRMQRDHCCHVCMVENGKGHHSRWCSSVLTQGRRLEQLPAEEKEDDGAA